MTKMILTLFTLCAVIACSKRYYYEELESRRIVKVFEREEVAEELYLGSVEAGETLNFKITGADVFYVKEDFTFITSASWSYRSCMESIATGREHCNWRSTSGKCEMFYRKFVESREVPIDFSKLKDMPFEIQLGDGSYPLSEVVNDGHTLYGKITVLESMLVKGRDLKIKAIQGEPQVTRLGFLKFGRCEGTGKRNFKVMVSLDQWEDDAYIGRELKVSVTKEIVQ